MRLYSILTSILWGSLLNGQVYTVNSNDDIDDGICNGVHCSLREAINAAEADGVVSTILFNISGAGPHIINALDTFPAITQPDLTIIGESQPGGSGSIIIDFNYRDLAKNNPVDGSFWFIDNRNFEISGITFIRFFLRERFAILNIGSRSNAAKNVKIYNCSFHTDSLYSGAVSQLNHGISVLVHTCDGFLFRKNLFGTDYSKSSIYKTSGDLQFDVEMNNMKATIDSNIFVNTGNTIIARGGNLLVADNIFGTIDTLSSVFVDLQKGIEITEVATGTIINNYFKGNSQGILTFAESDINVYSNRFYFIPGQCIYINGNSGTRDSKVIKKIDIKNNIAKNCGTFIRDIFVEVFELNIVDNYAENLDIFCQHLLSNPKDGIIIKHISNQIFCIARNPIDNGSPKAFVTAPPIISGVINKEIIGTSKPFDSISVYVNPRTNCADADCRGGFEIGRTQANASGIWVLSQTLIPPNTNISAYAYNPDPMAISTVYSEFSNCICPENPKIRIDLTMCTGETFIYRGKVYSEVNPYDSIFIKGNGNNVCDSVIVVKLNYSSVFRSQLDLNLCYQDTIRFGLVEIYKNHLIDSLQLKSISGCDSVVVITGKEVGVSNFSNSYCDSSSVLIGSTVFDYNHPSGIARIKGASQSGCDSVIFVNLNFNFSSETFINRNLCPGESVNVSGQLFDENKPSGDVILSNASDCDSVIHINLTYPNTTGFFTTTLCSGDSILVDKEYFSERRSFGMVTISKGSSLGCDSLINVIITYLPEASHAINTQICRNETIQVGSQFFSANNPSGIVHFPNRSSNGCDSVVHVFLKINPSIFMDFTAKDLICNLPNTGELSVKDLRGGSGNLKYSIDGGPSMKYIQDTIIGNISQGTHTIRIIDALSCDTSYNFNIDNSAILSLQLPNDTTVHKGDPINIISNINFNPATIIWSPASYMDCDTCLNPQSKPENDITYTLTLIDENGCVITDQITISVLIDEAEIFIPTAFSPNGDNINDIFGPIFKFPNSTRILAFRIFDRWGNQIYERLNGAIGESFGWDGTSKGEKMNPGVYVYTIQFVGDDKLSNWKTGDITLVR